MLTGRDISIPVPLRKCQAALRYQKWWWTDAWGQNLEEMPLWYRRHLRTSTLKISNKLHIINKTCASHHPFFSVSVSPLQLVISQWVMLSGEAFLHLMAWLLVLLWDRDLSSCSTSLPDFDCRSSPPCFPALGTEIPFPKRMGEKSPIRAQKIFVSWHRHHRTW